MMCYHLNVQFQGQRVNSLGYYNDLKFAIVKSVTDATHERNPLYLNSDIVRRAVIH